MPHSQPARLARALVVAALLALAILMTSFVGPAPAHRHGCHRAHSCPSDHATYVWHGYRCVKPSSDKRTSKFKKKVRYGGKTYYCKRA